MDEDPADCRDCMNRSETQRITAACLVAMMLSLRIVILGARKAQELFYII